MHGSILIWVALSIAVLSTVLATVLTICGNHKRAVGRRRTDRLATLRAEHDKAHQERMQALADVYAGEAIDDGLFDLGASYIPPGYFKGVEQGQLDA